VEEQKGHGRLKFWEPREDEEEQKGRGRSRFWEASELSGESGKVCQDDHIHRKSDVISQTFQNMGETDAFQLRTHL